MNGVKSADPFEFPSLDGQAGPCHRRNFVRYQIARKPAGLAVQSPRAKVTGVSSHTQNHANMLDSPIAIKELAPDSTHIRRHGMGDETRQPIVRENLRVVVEKNQNVG